MDDIPLRVATVCTGNICRSPMAEVMLKDFVNADAQLRGRVVVSSAGTARWHVGAKMDPRARRALDRAGFFGEGSLGAYADTKFLNAQDFILVMTREHRTEVLQRLTNLSVVVEMWRNLIEPESDLDLADPYYGGNDEFDACLCTLREGIPGLLGALRQQLRGHADEK